MPKKFTTKKGAGNKGQDYEIVLAALFSLIIFEDNSISDFILRSNIKEFESLDDLIITIDYVNGTQENYAFQIKHKEQQNLRLKLKDLDSKKDYNILKYYNDFCELANKTQEDYNCILYTNAYLELETSCNTNAFRIIETTTTGREYFFLSSSSNAKIYTFQITDTTTNQIDENFSKKFAFYTLQKNWGEIKNEIIEKFEKIFKTRDSSISKAYIDIFTFWKLHEYSKVELNKQDLKIQILNLFLTPYIITPSTRNNKKFNTLNEAFTKFDFVFAQGLNDDNLTQIVLMEDCQKDELVRYAKDLKFLTKSATEADLTESKKNDLKHKIGYYLKQKPIIVKICEANALGIITAILKFKKPQDELHFIFCGDYHLDREIFVDYTLLENLEDLFVRCDSEFKSKLTQQMKINLMGRQYFYGNFAFDNDEMTKKIKIKSIFEMLSGNFYLKTVEETLSDSYISRYLLTTKIKIKDIDKIYNDLILVSFKENSKTLDFLKNLTHRTCIELDKYLKKEETFFSNYLVYQNEISFMDFEKICEKTLSNNIHHFAIYDEEFLEWINIKGDINNLTEIGCPLHEVSISENLVYDKYQIGINVITATAGMGKSELLKTIKSNCPKDFFPILINLNEHNSLFNCSRTDDEIIQYLINHNNEDFLLKNIKIDFAKNKKIFFYFDGLDELQQEYIEKALTVIYRLSKIGFKFWLSSRLCLEEKIKNRLHVCPIKIKTFSRKDQEEYIQNRLKNHPKVEEIIKEIFENFDTILDNKDILEIPLQLFMVTDYLMETINSFSKNMLVLSEMFRKFLTGKYQHFFKKNKCKHWKELQKVINDSQTYRLQQYKIAALKSCLPNDFHKLNLKLDESFIKQIQNEGDFLGIIIKWTSNNIIFHHNVTASYLAAFWFAENYQTCKNFLKEILFKEKNIYIRILFDMILAEDYPAHIAVLYKNIKALEHHKKEIYKIDKGGRSTLHLACAHGSRSINFMNSQEKMTINQIKNMKESEEKSQQILEFLLKENVDLTLTDGVFDWNNIKFANETSLFSLDKIVSPVNEQYAHIQNEIYNLDIIKNITPKLLFYFGAFHYKNLFEQIFKKVKLEPQELTELIKVVTALNNWRIVDFLLENQIDIETNIEYGRTMLHVASSMNHQELVTLLLVAYKADINCRDEFGKTPLHLAARKGNYWIVKKLLKQGANINACDKNERNVLHEVIYHGNENMATFLIKNYSADLEARQWNGWGPLELAIISKHEKLIEILLNKNINFEHTDIYGTKPLHLAATKSTIKIFEMILNKSKKIDDVTKDGRTSLHLVAQIGNVNFFEYLLNQNANINAQDNNGKSVLHWAITGNNYQIVEILLKHNANIFACDQQKRNCLDWAYELADFSIIQLLRKKIKI